MNRLWVRLTIGSLGIVLLLLLMVTLAVNYSVTSSFRQFVIGNGHGEPWPNCC